LRLGLSGDWSEVGGVGGGISGGADGDLADGVIADVALVVGVDDVLRRTAEVCEGGEEAWPVCGGVDVEQRRGEGGGIVDNPAE
jgi:hypothetical protein